MTLLDAQADCLVQEVLSSPYVDPDHPRELSSGVGSEKSLFFSANSSLAIALAQI